MQRAQRIDIFVREIWQWFACHKRDLPWRDLPVIDDSERAYRILVSEIMLQQTQVSRVKIVYKDFLDRFPSIECLAQASNKDVILAWRGMGYNNRALRLRDAAQQVTKRASSDFPTDMETLTALPGVGHYTAAAIRNFAFNIPTPCLDTNIRRILHRAFVGPENPDGTWKKDDTYLLILAEKVLNVALQDKEGTPRLTCEAWHAALMDFGSLVCIKANPKWDRCPLTRAGIMKAAHRVPSAKQKIANRKIEPGRLVGLKHVPNRIFRGKVIEELRSAQQGLSSNEIGRRICIDWSPKDHSAWLEGIIAALKKDQLITEQRGNIVLMD